MNRTESELIPRFVRKRKSSIKGNRTRHRTTSKVTKAGSNDQLTIEIPKLNDKCLVPRSMNVLFDFTVSNTKSHFLNNLSKLLQKRLLITISGKPVYDNSAESFYSIYKDLHKTKMQRKKMIQYGIGSENLRNLISKDDSGATSGNATKVSGKLIFDIYGTKQKLPLDKIINDHGLFAPFQIINNFK